MPVNLSVKNVPDELADKLRARAERNHRSLQRELIAILEQAVQPGGLEPLPDVLATPARRIGVDEMYAIAKRLFPKGSPSSVDFIRQSRDGRYGEEWARTGKHKEPE
jgi:plasmid stability protein